MSVEWDNRYSNSRIITNYQEYIDHWKRSSEDFRKKHAPETIRYGKTDREYVDIFGTSRTEQNLVFFVHGGCWMDFSKDDWSYLARGSIENGWAFAVPSYTLCPNISISAITLQIAECVAHLSDRFSGKIVLVGHSAGGHLVSRMMCSDTALRASVLNRITRVVGISGLYDLRPLLNTSMNETLQLTIEEAVKESSILSSVVDGIPFLACIGSEELPDFHRQTTAIESVWLNLGAQVDYYNIQDAHHFNVIEPLADSDSHLISKIIGSTSERSEHL